MITLSRLVAVRKLSTGAKIAGRFSFFEKKENLENRDRKPESDFRKSSRQNFRLWNFMSFYTVSIQSGSGIRLL